MDKSVCLCVRRRAMCSCCSHVRRRAATICAASVPIQLEIARRKAAVWECASIALRRGGLVSVAAVELLRSVGLGEIKWRSGRGESEREARGREWERRPQVGRLRAADSNNKSPTTCDPCFMPTLRRSAQCALTRPTVHYCRLISISIKTKMSEISLDSRSFIRWRLER